MIPKNETEKEILQRLQKLEQETFGGTAETNYHSGTGRRDTGRTDEFSDETPLKDYQDYRNKNPKENEDARNTAKKISDGKTENQHIGKHTPETIQQEINSLMNTKTIFRNKKWWNRFRFVTSQLPLMREQLGDAKFQELILLMNDIAGGKQVDL